MKTRSGFRRFLLAGTAALALTAVTALSEVAQAEVTFNGALSAWGTNANGSGGNAFTNLGGGIWGTDAIPDGTTRYVVGQTFPDKGVYNFAFGNSGVQTAPNSPASFNIADIGAGTDIRVGDTTKLVFDATNGNSLQFAAAMGRVSNMTIALLGDGKTRITMIGQAINPVASASDPTGNTIQAGYALSLLMDTIGTGTIPSGIPDQHRSIFSTDMYFSDVAPPDLTGVTGVALRANGVNGVTGSFTALIPLTEITNAGLTPLSVAGANDKSIPSGFSLIQNGAVTIDDQTYYSYTLTNSAWSAHDLQFGQTTGTSIINTVVSNQGTNTTLVKSGTGTLILMAANTYTGGTTVSGGTLSLGNNSAAGTGTITTTGSVIDYVSGVSIANAININSNTTQLQVTTGSATQAGVISETSGPRPLEKIGNGTLVLTGINTYTGVTTVSAGTLSVNGSVAGAVTIKNGGTLKGTGTVGSLSFASGSIIAPGNSIGTLNVAGNATLASGSIYRVEVDSVGASDRIAATGVATLSGGSVLVQPAAGTYLPVTTYRILDAVGGVSGTFSGVTSGSSAFIPALIYSSKAVDLRLVNTAAIKFEAFGSTPNQIATGAAVTAAGSANPLFTTLATVVANSGALPPALDALSGEIHATLLAGQFETATLTRRTVMNRMRDRQDIDTGWSLWGDVSGDWGSIDSDSNAAYAKRSGVNITAGADTSLGENWRGGFEGGYSSGELSVAARSSSADMRGGHVGAYAYGRYDAVALRMGGSYGFGNAKTIRAISFTNFSDNANASQDTNSAQLFGEVGYEVALDTITLEPFAGLAWTHLNAGAFRESGGSAAVSGTSRDMDDGFSTLGLAVSTLSFDLGGAALTPSLRAGWQHAFTNNPASRSLSFVGTTQSFTVLGTPLDADRAVIDLGAALALSDDTEVTLGYTGTLGNHSNDHAVRLMGVFEL